MLVTIHLRWCFGGRFHRRMLVFIGMNEFGYRSKESVSMSSKQIEPTKGEKKTRLFVGTLMKVLTVGRSFGGRNSPLVRGHNLESPFHILTTSSHQLQLLRMSSIDKKNKQ